MKKVFIFICLLNIVSLAQIQTLIQSFDNAVGPVFLDPPVLNETFFAISPGSYCKLSNDTTHIEGTGSMKIDYKIQAAEGWGGYVARTTYKSGQTDAITYLDLSDGMYLKLRYKVLNPALMTADGTTTMEFKMAEIDAAGLRDLWLHKIAINLKETSSGWLEVDIPLERNNDNTKGFSLQVGDGDGELQLEHIKGFEFMLVYAPTAGGGDTSINSTGSFLLDNLTHIGRRSIPVVFFNGKYLPAALGTGWTWGQSTLELVQAAGRVPELSALKWVQGNEWNNGLTGIGFNINPTYDMSWSWSFDSLKFWMKAETGVGPIRIQLEGGSGKVGKVFQPSDDNQWHQYILPLKDFVPQDSSTGFDSTKVSVFKIMAEASGIAGKEIYLSEIWTGNPRCDCLPPDPVNGLAVFPGKYKNIITWTDVPKETGEKYDLFYSDRPITDITKAEVLKIDIPENTQLWEQMLRTASTDQDLTYYYAIVCKNVVLNPSQPAYLNSPTINKGKGVPTIAKTPPVNFKADGNLEEWIGFPQINIIKSEGTGLLVEGGKFDGDMDISMLAYLAVDKDYLYFGADVIDDIYSYKKRSDPWMNDAVNLYLGLFDSHNTYFYNYSSGATPHYSFLFDEEKVSCYNSDSLLFPGANYYFGQKSSHGYIIEAKISFVDIAQKRNYNYFGTDNVFHPVEGMKIPIDFSINDADATGSRELVFCYSPYNEDDSWLHPWRWLWTWIGDKMTVGVDEVANNVIANFNLVQNYPNPFNPSTTINYQIPTTSFVTLKVYDVLGNEVETLLNEEKSAGVYKIDFNGSKLASGIYFYTLRANNFVQNRKMILIK